MQIGIQHQQGLAHCSDDALGKNACFIRFLLRLLAPGDVLNQNAAPPFILFDGFDVHPDRISTVLLERHLAGLLSLAFKYFPKEGIENGTSLGGNEYSEVLLDQSAAFYAQQIRPGQIGAVNHAVARQGKITGGGKVVQTGILMKKRFQFGLRPNQFFILQLQFNLVHFQFVDETQGVCLCHWRSHGFLAFAHLRFRLAAKTPA